MGDKDENGINTVEILMGIKEDVAKLSTKIEDMESTNTKVSETETKAEYALSLAESNQRAIENLTSIYYKTMEILGGGIVVTLFVYVIQQFI